MSVPPSRWNAADMLSVELEDDERSVLMEGIGSYGGPARMTDLMARAIGFDSYDHLVHDGSRIFALIRAREPMSRWDWSRALLAAELSFGSDLMGAGVEWSMVGTSDERTLPALRALQFKLISVRIPVRYMDGLS